MMILTPQKIDTCGKIDYAMLSLMRKILSYLTKKCREKGDMDSSKGFTSSEAAYVAAVEIQ